MKPAAMPFVNYFNNFSVRQSFGISSRSTFNLCLTAVELNIVMEPAGEH